MIGILIYGLFALMGGFMVWLLGNDNLLENIFGEEIQQNIVYFGDFTSFVDVLDSGGWLLIITSVLSIVFGVIAVLLTRKNKQPKIAGIIFIIVAVASTVASFGLGIFGGLFYLIAGIMCLVRKPPQT